MITDRDMSQDFETFGNWFVPDNPDRRVAGTLVCRSERIELELTDSLAPMQSGPIREEIVEYAVIHGVTREQEAVSPFQCTRTRYSIRFASGGIGQPEKFWNHSAVVGAHVKTRATLSGAEMSHTGFGGVVITPFHRNGARCSGLLFQSEEDSVRENGGFEH